MDPEARVERNDAEVSLLDYLRVIRRHWRVEVGLFLTACLVAGVVSLLLPKEYEATASVLPPSEPKGSKALEALIGQTGAGPFLGGLLSGTDTKDIFVGILKSRTMQDDIINKFELIKAFGLERSRAPMQNSRARLAGMTSVKVSKEGVISVAVSAYEPKIAAGIANFYVENLDRLNATINSTDAGRTRLFLEGRAAEAQKGLRDAENRLKEFQSRSRAVVMEGQAKAAVESAAKLEGEIIAAEVQLKTLETFATQRNPDVIRMREGIDEMRRQLKRMEYGRTTGNPRPEPGGAVADYSVPLGSIPATGVELVRLIREAKIQETIFTLLTQQLEQAKIAEAKDMPTVRILDRAVVPEWKSRPKVLLNVILAGVSSLFIAVFLAFFLEYLEGARRREAHGS